MHTKWLPLITLLIILGFAGSSARADDPAPPPAAEAPCDNPENFLSKVRCGPESFFGHAGYATDVIETEGTPSNPLALRVGIVVRTALSLVAVVFVMITVYSGIQWMMAGGNEETVKKARTRLTRATIGLFIVMGAWIITSFILGSALQGPREQDTRTFRPFVQ